MSGLVRTLRAAMIALMMVLVGGSFPSLVHAVEFDFSQTGESARWKPAHDVATLVRQDDGMLISITGGDPFIEGPLVDFDVTIPLYVRVRVKSDVGGTAQLFWFADQTTEDQSIHFWIEAGRWNDLCLPLPPVEKRCRFRFDPPGASGTCVLSRMDFDQVGRHGLSNVEAKQKDLQLTMGGVTGDVEIVELSPNLNLTDVASAPIVFQGHVGDGQTISIPRFISISGRRRDRLDSGFAVLQRHPRWGKTAVGPVKYVNQFSDVSLNQVPFPAAKSKKGLQVQMVDDALKLGVQHAALNVSFTGLLDFSPNPNSLTWEMDGETYYFHRHAVEGIPVKPLSDLGCVVALILLATESGNPAIDAILLHPQRIAKTPNGIAAFNTVTVDGLRHYKACCEFLADRFSQSDSRFGRVANYIVGNEVTAHWEWYNMGLAPRELVVADYERSVRIAHTAIRKYSSSARVYLSLEHHWTLANGGDPRKAIPGRRFLEEFNRRAILGGNYDWNLAYHPYPENLFQPRTWNDKSARANQNSPRITFKNLEQLTQFMSQPEFCFEAKPRRIILSEQGFHSDDTNDGDLAQAAGYCYAWEKVSRLDAIDSFILHRHVDHAHEGGLNLGLWKRQPNSVADPLSPRPMYDVFLKADTSEHDAAFRFALPVIGIDNWDQILKATP